MTVGEPELIVSEEQWLFAGNEASPRSILALARIQGAQLERLSRSGTIPVELITVQDWRDALGLKGISKTVAQNRCLDSLTPGEVAALPERNRLDALDAIMIGWGWFIRGGKSWLG